MLWTLALLLPASADDSACHLVESDNSDDAVIVLDHVKSTCEIELDELVVTIKPSDDADACKVVDGGGGNIIVIWPRETTQRVCFADGIVGSIGIVMDDNL